MNNLNDVFSMYLFLRRLKYNSTINNPLIENQLNTMIKNMGGVLTTHGVFGTIDDVNNELVKDVGDYDGDEQDRQDEWIADIREDAEWIAKNL